MQTENKCIKQSHPKSEFQAPPIVIYTIEYAWLGKSTANFTCKGISPDFHIANQSKKANLGFTIVASHNMEMELRHYMSPMLLL